MIKPQHFIFRFLRFTLQLTALMITTGITLLIISSWQFFTDRSQIFLLNFSRTNILIFSGLATARFLIELFIKKQRKSLRRRLTFFLLQLILATIFFAIVSFLQVISFPNHTMTWLRLSLDTQSVVTL
jgi:hypothetical protein